MRIVHRLTLAEKVTLAFIMGVVYLALVGAVAYSSVFRFANATERATRTHVVLRSLEETFSLVTGAETGSRGFMITGDARYLEPYRNAEMNAAARLKSLEALIADDPRQRERLEELIPLVARRFAGVHSVQRQDQALSERESCDARGQRSGRHRALTVFDPAAVFVTGGGKFLLAGGDRVSFGLSFTYTKGKTTGRGGIVVVRHHADGGRCRVKSNSMDAPAVNGTTASLTGKGNYTCVDSDGATTASQGNLSILGYVEDNGTSGAGQDKFWIRAYSELFMALPPASNAVLLTGGNIQVPQPSSK